MKNKMKLNTKKKKNGSQTKSEEPWWYGLVRNWGRLWQRSLLQQRQLSWGVASGVTPDSKPSLSDWLWLRSIFHFLFPSPPLPFLISLSLRFEKEKATSIRFLGLFMVSNNGPVLDLPANPVGNNLSFCETSLKEYNFRPNRIF